MSLQIFGGAGSPSAIAIAVAAHITALHPYKVYTATLTQPPGPNAPVATVLQNTLGGVPVWSREADGTYDLTLAGAFPVNKTWLMPTQLTLGSGDLYSFSRLSDNVLEIYTVGDGNLGAAFAIEVRVYP